MKDIKQKLLGGMNNLLSQGMKIQTILAWGWFIRLVGSHALKNRHLVNDMLKIPEHTFSDHDSQVQIASQVLPNISFNFPASQESSSSLLLLLSLSSLLLSSCHLFF